MDVLKLVRLLLKVSEVTTEHKKSSKICINSLFIFSFFTLKDKISFGQSPPQELGVNPCSGLYPLVTFKAKILDN